MQYKYIAVLIIIITSIIGISRAQSQKLINVISWGVAYTKSQDEAYYKPFTNETGIKINSIDYNGEFLKNIREQVDNKKIKWDIIDVMAPDAISGCEEGLLEPIDHSILLNAPDGTNAANDFIDGALKECAVANIV